MNYDNKLESQVVVIGGGGAGMSAAVAAAEKGASVILLEKSRKPGGTSAAAVDIFGVESPVQKRAGIEANKDDFFKIAMDYTHWEINPKIMRAFINKSGDTIRWLEEKGVSFVVNERTFVRFNHTIPFNSHCPKDTDGAGIIRALVKALDNLDGRLLCGTEAKELETNEKGEVIGILAKTKDGQELNIKTSSVVIATGGYGGNKELLRKYCPYYNENITLAGYPNMGDGLLMALKIGAATEGLGNLHLESKGLPREPKQMWIASLQPFTLWVNAKGERFTDESIDNVFEAANPVLRQPKSISFTIFDEKIKQKISDTLDKIMVRFKERDRGKGRRTWLPMTERVAEENFSQLLELAVDKGDVKIANSWDEMAGWIGANPKVLKATIDEYNASCDKGYDEDFIKDPKLLIPLRNPPFYAIKCVMRFLGTIGGIKINHHMEVMDTEGNPIPGVFAAGIDTGGWEPPTYNQLLTGHALGFAYNSGRIAGENAAEYVKYPGI